MSKPLFQSVEEIQETIDSLVEKGLLKEIVMEDGQPGYALTEEGRKYYNLMTSPTASSSVH